MSRDNDTALPYFRWYINDHMASHRARKLSVTAEGVYRRLLDECWKTGYIPSNSEQLAEICRCPLTTFVRAWKQVRGMFITLEGLDGELLTNERLEAERTKEDRKRVQKSIAGKASAAKRNVRQQTLNGRYIAVKAEQSSSMDERSLALDDARPLVIDPDAACEECGSKGSAFAAGIHKPGCSLAPRELPRVSRVGAE